MPFSKKHGKGRRDKYYFMAKDSGYRSRASYKLLELEREYNFLGSARALIDLCAAPGGWLQVAQKYMPMSSLILGIDLDPIQPIKGVSTLVGDIRTEKCRKDIAAFLKGWRADVFLHDGAPNMGQDWNFDAYSQATLVLESVKLASEFLTRGGTFVTKVFRSKDYNALLWVFKQLFGRVEATKPQASRGVSAEIFVVCLEFKAPDSIDPRMFDPSSVFADVEGEAKLPDIFKSKQKRNRSGYADDAGTLLFKQRPLAALVDAEAPHEMLAEINAFTAVDAESKVYMAHPATTDEILACLADIRVLSKRELKRLLKWRGVMRKFVGLDAEDEVPEVTTTTLDLSAVVADEDLLAAEMARFKDRQRLIEKRQKRKERVRMAKYQQSLTISMPTTDLLETAGDTQLFALASVPTKTAFEQVAGNDVAALDAIGDEEVSGVYVPADATGGEENEDALAALDTMVPGAYDAAMEAELELDYARRAAAAAASAPRVTVGKKIKRVRKLGVSTELYLDLKAKELGLDAEEAALAKLKPNVDDDIFADDKLDGDESSDEDGAETSSDDGANDGSASESSDTKFFNALRAKRKHTLEVALAGNPLIAGPKPAADAAGAAASALGSIFDGLEAPEDASVAVATMIPAKADAKRKRRSASDSDDGEGASGAAVSAKRQKVTGAAKTKKSVRVRGGPMAAAAAEGRAAEEDGSTESSSDDGEESSASSLASFDVVPMDPMSFSDSDDKAEYLAMAKGMAGRKRRESLIDKSYNRRAFNEEDLPSWYMAYLRDNNQMNMPVTKEMVDEMKLLHKAVNARPIKRVAEAKSRKKMRAARKLDKMKRAVAAVANDTDLSETARARTIERLYRAGNKAVDKPKRRLIIGKKHQATGGKSSTKTYKMVDRRLRADAGGRGRTSKKVKSKRSRFKKR